MVAHNVGWSQTAIYPLVEFLIRQNATLLHFENPIIYKGHATLTHFALGRMRWRRSFRRLPGSPVLQYFYGLIRVLALMPRIGRVDLLIAGDEMYGWCGTMLRLSGFVNVVVFYSVDFIQKKFSNSILNYLYTFMTLKTVRSSDFVWNISERCRQARLKQCVTPEKMLVVPHAVDFPTSMPEISQSEPCQLVYVGALEEAKGLQLVIRALPRIIEAFPSLKLTVVGDGPFGSHLRDMVKSLRITESVFFLGRRSREDVSRILSKSRIGLATYVPPTIDSPTYYSFPAKVIEYLGSGLPVITTEVGISDEISREGCGLVIAYDEASFTEAALKLLKLSEADYRAARDRARGLAARYKSSIVFGDAFSRLRRHNSQQ